MIKELRKKLSKGETGRRSLVNIGLKFGGIVVSYLFTMMVTNLFGADVYGSFTIGFVVISLVSMLSTFGLGTALLKFIAGEEGENRSAAIKNLFLSAYGIVGISSIIAAVLVYMGAEAIASGIFQKPELVEVIKVAAFGIIPTALLNVNSQALRGAEKIELHMFFEHVSRYFLPLAIIPVLAQAWSGSELVITVFVSCLWVLWLVSTIIYLRASGFWLSKREEKAVLKTLLVVALPLILAKSSGFLKNWSDTMIIGSYLETDQTGIYNVVIRISKLLAIPLTAINAMQAPRIAKLFAKEDMLGLRTYIRSSTQMIVGLTLPGALLLLIFPKFFLGMFGPEFVGASDILMIIAVGYVINALAGSVGLLLQMTGHERSYMVITMSTLTVSIGLNFALIPTMGIKGAAITTVVSQLLFNGSAAIYAMLKVKVVTVFLPWRIKA